MALKPPSNCIRCKKCRGIKCLKPEIKNESDVELIEKDPFGGLNVNLEQIGHDSGENNFFELADVKDEDDDNDIEMDEGPEITPQIGMQVEEPGTYSCKECPDLLLFQSFYDIIEHLKEYHEIMVNNPETLYGRYKRKCGLLVGEENEIDPKILREFKEEEEEMVCNICKVAGFLNEDSFEEHIEKQHRGYRFKCTAASSETKCHLLFKTFSKRAKHEEQHLNTNLRKNEKRGKKHEDMNLNVIKQHRRPSTPDLKDTKIWCNICVLQFSNPKALSIHNTINHSKKSKTKPDAKKPSTYKCKECPDFSVQSFNELVTHIQDYHEFDLANPETLCRRYKRKYGLLVGEENKIDPEMFRELEETELLCNICEATGFLDEDAFEEHIEKKHNKYRFKCTASATDSKKCYRLFYTISKRDDHEKGHSTGTKIKRKYATKKAHLKTVIVDGSEKKECPTCGKLFASKYLYKHRISMHDFENCKHWCQICNLPFRDARALNYHNAGKHENVELPCKFCEKTFSNNHLLDQHMRAHSSVLRYDCNQCDQKFSAPDYLKYHLKHAHNPATIQCEFCSKLFADMNQLKNHAKVHSETFEFTCEICSKGFKWKQNYETHLAAHAKGTYGKCRKNLDIDRPFKCEICEADFPKLFRLNDHIKVKHCATKPPRLLEKRKHECEICGRVYSSYASLYQHRKNKNLHKRLECGECKVFIVGKERFEEHVREHMTEKQKEQSETK